MRLVVLLLQCLIFWGLLPTSLNASTLVEIERRKTIRIGVKDNTPLLGFKRADGTLDGFEIELAQKISQTIWGDRIQVEFLPLLNQERLSAVSNHRVDLAIANLHVTEARRRVVSFSHPYLKSQTRFVTKTLSPATFPLIKAGKIGVLQGSVAIGRLRSAFPDSTLVGVSTYQEAQQKIRSNQIDSFAGDLIALRGWQYGSWHSQNEAIQIVNQAQSPRFQLSQKGLGLSQIAIAMPKGLQYRNLHDAINLALVTLEDTGELQQMRNKWRLSLVDPTALDRLDKTSERLERYLKPLKLAPNVN